MFSFGEVAVAPAPPPGSAIILNEYNAVGSGKLLKDDRADVHFGRVPGNGGDWIELAVVAGPLDLRGARFEWREGERAGAFALRDVEPWSAVPAATILTFIAQPTAKGGLDSVVDANRAWRNTCIEDIALIAGIGDAPPSLRTGNDDFVLTVRDRDGRVLFGPVGEGSDLWPGGGVGSDEIAQLRVDPSTEVRPDRDYDDGVLSTFGAPNRWLVDGVEHVQRFGGIGVLADGPAGIPARAPAFRAPASATTDDPLPTDERGAPLDPASVIPDVNIGAGEDPRIELRRLITVDIPGPSAEILAFEATRKLLLSVNPLWKTLDVFTIEGLDHTRSEPPTLVPLPDFDEDLPGIQGIPMIGSPTSVAVHPTQPIAMVTVIGRSPTLPGRLIGYDLRAETFGRWVVDQPVGFHPDSLAISPDGRWAVVANEGEGSPDVPGTITVVDLAGISPDDRAVERTLPSHEITGLGRWLETYDGAAEPEYVAIDPDSRFALVTCQENDAALLVDLRTTPPQIGGVLWTPFGAEPDGVALIADVPGPDGRIGALAALAEEGRFDPIRQMYLGNTVSFAWIDPDALDAPVPLTRVDVRPLVQPGNTTARRDPESVTLLRIGGRILCLVAIERGDRLLALDVTEVASGATPRSVARARTGSRPEGLLVIPDGDRAAWILTGDEGNDGPGEITILRLTVP